LTDEGIECCDEEMETLGFTLIGDLACTRFEHSVFRAWSTAK
jgi:hypothetical protein